MAVKITNKRPPSTTKVGRKPSVQSLTPEMLETCGEAMRLGMPQGKCAALIGLSESVFSRLLKRNNNEAAEYLLLCKRQGEKANLQIVQAHAAKSWQAACWLLERCNGQDYAQRTQTSAGSSSAGSVLLTLVQNVTGKTKEATKQTTIDI